MNELTYGISIYVEDTGKTFHTLDDWDLALGNNNYIGDPKMETTYIKVPGRNGLIDASEAVSGRRVFTKRALSFELGGKNPRLSWDGIISAFRNEIHGRTCQLILDNDKGYYWRGRVFVEGFDRFRDLGRFTLSIPSADPYKYSVISSAEPWLWDPFNFNTDMITYLDSITVAGPTSVTIPHGNMLVTPDIVASNVIGTLTLTVESITYTLTSGSNRIPAVMVGGDDDVELVFDGNAEVQIVYRSGSL
jgi:Phage tail protein.